MTCTAPRSHGWLFGRYSQSSDTTMRRSIISTLVLVANMEYLAGASLGAKDEIRLSAEMQLLDEGVEIFGRIN